MRYIPLLDYQPDPTWIAKANKLLAQLETASRDERKKIIDDNATIWGELKAELLKLSHQKCWFSEAKDCFSHWDVEHYRPKKSAKDIDGSEVEGYWWLAFDWKNFRICGNVGNRMKGTFFPVRPSTSRIVYGQEIYDEDPMLLDPIDADDVNLLSFNVLGKAIPSAGVKNTWERDRVEYSVTRFKLNFPPLEEKRKTVWQTCHERICDYLEELKNYNKAGSLTAKDRYKKAAKEVRKMIKEDQELSSVARACILNSNDPRVIQLLQTS